MWLQAANFSYLGIFFGISVVIGQSCGGYLDGRFHTTPWLRMLGVLFGLAAGFKELYRIAKRYQRSLDKDKASEAAATPVPEPTERPGSKTTSGSQNADDKNHDDKNDDKDPDDKDDKDGKSDAAKDSWV